MTPGPVAFLAGLALILVWDVALAGRMAQLRRATPFHRALSGLCGFLVAPALLLSIGAQSALTGRALEGLAWCWPLVLMMFAMQAAYAALSGVVSPLVALPLFALSAVQAFVAAVRYAGSLGYDLPLTALAPGMAQAQLLSAFFGTAAAVSPFAVTVPILAPAFPARTRWGAAARAVLATLATAMLALFVLRLPSAWSALDGYRHLAADQMTERGRGSFTVGLRILPEITGLPPSIALREDLQLADSLDVAALLVRVAPEGCTAPALDSLARALEPYRRDSTLLFVTLAYPRAAMLERRLDPARYVERRATDVDLLVRHLRPDYLIPADAPYAAGADALGVLPASWWTQYFERTAAAAHRVRPATRMVLSTSASGPRDSALVAWAAGRRSPVDAIAFSFAPSAGGAVRLGSELATADRWMRNAGAAREHWLVVSGAPLLEGDNAQRRRIRHVLAWATARSFVEGVVLADATDYAQATGFRAADGRLRPAAGDVAAAIRTINETPPAPLP